MIVDNSFVVVNNSSELVSELGNKLITTYGNRCDYSCVYYDGGDKTKVSLRSDDNHKDVSFVAKNYLGGGHRNASGFIINSINDFGYKITYDNYKVLNECKDYILYICKKGLTMKDICVGSVCNVKKYACVLGSKFSIKNIFIEDCNFEDDCECGLLLYEDENKIKDKYVKYL